MKTTRHATYNLNYHIVWLPTYRDSVLVGEVAARVRDILHKIAANKGLEVIDLTVQPDHVHLFVSAHRNTPHPCSPTGARAFLPGRTPTVTLLTTVRNFNGHAATTQSATNDVVVDYELSGYTKNALKKYVPQLLDEDTYDAKELHADHPVRFTNEGPQLDHKPQNAIKWYVKIPHHDDYHLWIPAQINPEQRDWLEALYAGDAEMGECRLFDRDGEWYFHVVATRDVAERSTSASETPIGVDIGAGSTSLKSHGGIPALTRARLSFANQSPPGSGDDFRRGRRSIRDGCHRCARPTRWGSSGTMSSDTPN